MWSRFEEWLHSQHTKFELVKGETNEVRIRSMIENSGITSVVDVAIVYTEWKNRLQNKGD